MNSRTLLNIVLLALVVGLGLLAYYQPGTEKAEPTSLISVLDQNKITRLEIINSRTPKESAVLVKDGNGWQITSPMKGRANEQRVQSLLDLVKEPSTAKYSLASTDLKKFKLDAPEYKIKMDATEFSFGDTDPINSRRYVLVGNAIHLIEDKYIPHLLPGLAGLVSLDLLPPNSQIVSMKLPEISLKNEKGQWSISPSEALSADTINGFVDRWKNAHAMRATVWESINANKDITIQLKDSQEVYFSIVSKSPDLVLGNKALGIAFHFDEEQGNKLLKPTEEKANSPDESSPVNPSSAH